MERSTLRCSRLIKAVSLVAAVALGGCEMLSELMGDDTEGPIRSGADATGPRPPPAAPRVPRASAKRSANDRGTGDASAQAAENTGEIALPPGSDAAPMTAELRAATEAPAEVPGDRPAEVRTDLVIGLTEKSLVGWLGEPANRREQSPARIWRYLGAGCSLDVFLFLDLVSREFRALSYEVKGTTHDDQRCLQPVFAGRGSAPRTTASRLD